MQSWNQFFVAYRNQQADYSYIINNSLWLDVIYDVVGDVISDGVGVTHLLSDQRAEYKKYESYAAWPLNNCTTLQWQCQLTKWTIAGCC